MTDLVVVDVRIMWEYETLLAEKVAFVGKKNEVCKHFEIWSMYLKIEQW